MPFSHVLGWLLSTYCVLPHQGCLWAVATARRGADMAMMGTWLKTAIWRQSCLGHRYTGWLSEPLSPSCMIWRPESLDLWQLIQVMLEAILKQTGTQETDEWEWVAPGFNQCFLPVSPHPAGLQRHRHASSGFLVLSSHFANLFSRFFFFLLNQPVSKPQSHFLALLPLQLFFPRNVTLTSVSRCLLHVADLPDDSPVLTLSLELSYCQSPT